MRAKKHGGEALDFKGLGRKARAATFSENTSDKKSGNARWASKPLESGRGRRSRLEKKTHGGKTRGAG